MAVNMEQAIAWMEARRGKVNYSMDYRNGTNSYDCSSAVYFALMSAGASSAGWAVNTEYMHDWLIKNGYQLIAENVDWNAVRGDIAIWGKRGHSSGAGGHVVMFVDPENIIHCNYARNGITVDNYNQTVAASGWMYCYVYRLKSGASPKETAAGKTVAWINYMTNVNRTYGNFAIKDNEAFMVMNRNYELEITGGTSPTITPIVTGKQIGRAHV